MRAAPLPHNKDMVKPMKPWRGVDVSQPVPAWPQGSPFIHAEKPFEPAAIASGSPCREEASDPVTSPAHYARLQPEPLDVIEAWKLDHHSACAVKYIARAGHKGNRLEDLRKAAEYLRRLIALEEKSGG
jgi:hypothetical protein